MSTTIRGLGHLLKQLNDIGGNSKKILKETIEDCTVFVRDDARERCPSQTGDLRNSIDYEVEVKENEIIGTVSTNMDYATYVEFGTGKIGQMSNKNTDINLSYRQDGWTYWSDDLQRFVYTEGQVARPYMYPALHENTDQIRTKVIRDIRKEIERIAAK